MTNHVESWVPGAVVHFGTLRFLVTDGEDLLWEPTPATGRGLSAIGSVAESLGAFRLNGSEQRAPNTMLLPETSGEMVWRNITRFLGPEPAWEEVEGVLFSLANIIVQLYGGDPIPQASYGRMFE